MWRLMGAGEEVDAVRLMKDGDTVQVVCIPPAREDAIGEGDQRLAKSPSRSRPNSGNNFNK
jgi:hypothetical protein